MNLPPRQRRSRKQKFSLAEEAAYNLSERKSTRAELLIRGAQQLLTPEVFHGDSLSTVIEALQEAQALKAEAYGVMSRAAKATKNKSMEPKS